MKDANEVFLSTGSSGHRTLIDLHVTDLVTGFAGRVVQERNYLGAASKVCVAPDPQLGKRLEPERLIDIRRLRIDEPIRRRNAPPSAAPRYSHDAQQAIVVALWNFAANLQHIPHAGIEAQRKSDFTTVSLMHVDTALSEILAGLGYIKAGE